mmetsp:Transcript_62709/g.198574  ORF Transcript_62709/g.198574 Transcript_62709/m.198574 type:complete len:427 (+) Transcript_62709:1930-3210(+)
MVTPTPPATTGNSGYTFTPTVGPPVSTLASPSTIALTSAVLPASERPSTTHRILGRAPSPPAMTLRIAATTASPPDATASWGITVCPGLSRRSTLATPLHSATASMTTRTAVSSRELPRKSTDRSRRDFLMAPATRCAPTAPEWRKDRSSWSIRSPLISSSLRRLNTEREGCFSTARARSAGAAPTMGLSHSPREVRVEFSLSMSTKWGTPSAVIPLWVRSRVWIDALRRMPPASFLAPSSRTPQLRRVSFSKVPLADTADASTLAPSEPMGFPHRLRTLRAVLALRALVSSHAPCGRMSLRERLSFAMVEPSIARTRARAAMPASPTPLLARLMRVTVPYTARSAAMASDPWSPSLALSSMSLIRGSLTLAPHAHLVSSAMVVTRLRLTLMKHLAVKSRVKIVPEPASLIIRAIFTSSSGGRGGR